MKNIQLSLTQTQLQYLQTLLPHRYSLQVATENTKRNRAVKKMDESFTDDFNIVSKRGEERAVKTQQTISSKKQIEDIQVEVKK